MADTKISALTASSTPLAGTEVLPIVQSSTTKQVSVANLTAGRAVSAASLALTTSPLPATSGGTGSNSAFTANGVAYASSTTVLTTGSGLVFDGANLGVGTTTLTSGGGWTPRLVLAAAGSAPAWIIKGGSSQELSIGASDSMYIDCSGSTTGTNNNIILRTTSTNSDFSAVERVRIASNGIVSMSVYGAGAATFSASGVISSVSDETWKIKDGVPVDPDSMLNKLEPGYWYYNDEKKEIFGVDRQLGFYAQNVNVAIGPEAAPTPEEGKPWGYYDRSVLAVTVMSLQKALATIESLTARITALEGA
jgi:hypothetical protein